MLTFELREAESTRALGEWLASLLLPGDVMTLEGPLGAGKTTLVQGIAWGLGLKRHLYAQSPTYSLAITYPTTPPLYHVDLYRLGESPHLDVSELLSPHEELEHAITLVEWPQYAGAWLPVAHFHLHFVEMTPNARIAVMSATSQPLLLRLSEAPPHWAVKGVTPGIDAEQFELVFSDPFQ